MAMAHVLNHPCEGRDCRECTVCKFDEPIPVYEPPKKDETPVTVNGVCNYCGYLIKNYKDHGDTKYNACCGKHLIQSEGTTRPRTISFRLEGPVDIPIPDWCPKLLDSPISRVPQVMTHISNNLTNQPEKTAYEIYQEKRKKYEALPIHVQWEDIKEGKIYVIPTIIRQKGKVVLAVAKTEYTLRCVTLDKDLKETSYYHNVYRQDLDARFIVEYHKF